MENDEIQIDETGPDFLLASLETYLSSSTYYDATLICEDGRQFHAHKAVLASISPFLKSILLDEVFADNKEEYSGVTIHFPHVSFEELSLLLELAYTGKTNGNSKPGDRGSNRESVLNLLQTLQVTEDILEFEGSLDEDESHSSALLNEELMSSINSQKSNINGTWDNKIKIPKPRNQLNSLGSVSLVKVDNPKPKEKLKLSSSVVIAKVKPSSSSLCNLSSAFSKRNKTKSTNVHVEFAPTNTKPNIQRHIQLNTCLIRSNLIADQNVQFTSAILNSPNGKTDTLTKRINQPSVAPSTRPIDGSIDEHGFYYDKDLADKKTREILDRSHQDSSTCGYTMDVDTMQLGHANNVRGRKQERCQCPNCMDPNRDPDERRAATLHSCHYADCGKKYKKTSHLRAHLRWHVGDQPFMCSWKNCGKRFTRSDELHRHFRIHTGEKKSSVLDM